MKNVWISFLAVLFAWSAVSELSAAWLEHTIADSFSGAIFVESEDIDGDGDTDIVASSNGSDTIEWWENNGESYCGWSRWSLDSISR